jgi:hypothetical protein
MGNLNLKALYIKDEIYLNEKFIIFIDDNFD